MSAPTDPLIFPGKTSAELGYKPPDPRDSLPLIRTQLGLAEGHITMAFRLLRTLEHHLDGED